MIQKNIAPDLKTIAEGKGVKIPADLSIQWVEDARGKPALRVQPMKKEFFVDDDWVVVLPGIEFTDGVIEFDALGQSDPPQSNFLGFSFRFVDETAHDAVYFRPFNFRAGDADRKAHAVQYISHPKHHWFDLRKDKTGQYEKPIIPAPDGDAWFHARIVIARPKLSVYVNGANEPSLVVEELSDRKGGGIGLWIGPGQGGCFANLTIIPVPIPYLDEVRSFSNHLHATGKHWQGEIFGWSAEYIPERRRKPVDSKMTLGLPPAEFWIGESGIWFFSRMWKQGKDKEPVEFLDDRGIVK